MATNYLNGTTTQAVKATGGTLYKVIVNSHASGTLSFTDGAGAAAAGAKSVGTLTGSGVFTDGETITIGPIVYTAKTTLDTVNPYQFLIGANLAASLDNLKSAINDSGTEGTHYSVGTNAHPYVTATTNSDTAQVVEYRVVGTVGDALATTETCANAAWGAATLASGSNQSTLINNTYTLAAGSAILDFGPEGIDFKRGLYVTKGGTIDYTIIYA